MTDIYGPAGNGAFIAPAARHTADDALAAWQRHLDAGRLTPQPPPSPEIRAQHERTHRLLGLRCPPAPAAANRNGT